MVRLWKVSSILSPLLTCHCSMFQCSTRHILHLSDVYKFVNLFGIYNKSFLVVASEEYWPIYQGDVIFHNENMRMKKKGCLTSTHIRIEMDTVEKMKRKCGICRLTSHTRKRCPNVGTRSNIIQQQQQKSYVLDIKFLTWFSFLTSNQRHWMSSLSSTIDMY